MSSAPNCQIGDRVSVSGKAGTVRFHGPTNFQVGKWVGVELDVAGGGKNDGSVAGERYFTTGHLQGMFVRPANLAPLGDTATSRPATRPGSKPLAASTSRPGSSASVRPSLGARASTSTRPTPTPSGRSSVAEGRMLPPSTPRRQSAISPPPPSTLSRPPSVLRPPSRPLSSLSSADPGGDMLPPASRLPSSRAGSPIKRVGVANFAPPPGSPRMALGGVRRESTTSPAAKRRESVTSSVGGGLGPSRRESIASASSSTHRAGITSPQMGISSTFMQRGTSTSSSTSGLGVGRLGSPTRRVTSAGEDSVGSGGGESLMEEAPDWLNQPDEEDGPDEGDTTVLGAGLASPTLKPTTEPMPPPPQLSDPFSLKPTETRKAAEATVPKKEHDELLAKLRILQARREEDREKLREIDRHKEEAEDWNKVKEKTKAKITELSSLARELKRENHDLSLDRDALSSKYADLSDQVEISLLDKEVAEEQLEAAQHEVDVLKEKLAEMEVEVGVLREESKRIEGEGEDAVREGGEGGRSEVAYRQLERQNGRLKEALIRMRDLTSETEAEHKRHIADLEKELDLSTDMQAMFDNNLVELERAESQVEELKQQLDDALGAEDMLEQLTERNLTLSEKLGEMSAAVEDLEALQELSNELEENHVETEKQLQEEIDLKDLLLREQQQRGSTLEENVADYEGTINQFRELVLSLQSDLENLREHQATRETESQSLTSQSQAMLNLNLKLQSSVLKGQIKTIDLELRKLDAQQALTHLAITKPYLLPSFFEADSAAVEALLFFERLAYKSDLLSTIIEANHSVTDSLNSTVPETLVGICETRAKLGRYSALNKRFAAQIKRCPPDIFLRMGGVHRELAATEKRIDSFIDALRKEDLKEVECGREIEGLIAQEEHLAELHLQEPLLDIGEREHALIASLDLDFDTIAAAAGFTKQALATVANSSDIVVELGDVDLDTALYQPLQNLVNQARNSKVVTKKLLRRLDDLLSSSSALSLDHAHGFETLAYNSSAIASAAAKVATDIAQYCSDLRTSKQAFHPSAILALAREVTESELGKQSSRPFDEFNALLGQLAQDVATTLASAGEAEHVVKLAYEAPWLARVAELQSTAATNVEAERKVLKLNDEIKDLVREMRTKDQSHQESAVKIELMERRMEAVKAQADAMILLEADIAKLKKEKTVYEDAMETLQNDLDTMEKENVKLKQNAPAADTQGGHTGTHAEGETISYEGNLETWRLVEHIESLRGAVRFLRSENSYLKSQDLLGALDDLPSYTITVPPPRNPPEATGVPVRNRRSIPQDPVARQHAFAAESRLLLQEARVLSATPKVVDLSLIKRGSWQPGSRAPENQYRAEKERVRDLAKKVERLWQLRPQMVV